MAKAPAVPLAPGVWRIPVATSDGINAFAMLGNDGQVTLVDAGMPWAWKRLEAGLKHIGTAPSEVTQILVTHAHSDHVGNVAKVKQLSGAPAASHADDAEHLSRGESPPIDRAVRFHSLFQRLGHYPKFDVDRTFVDGELLDVAGGLRVVHTPGHTPGHTSYLHEPTGVLITGDAMHYWRGSIRIGIKYFCHDIALNEVSVHRLGELDYDVCAFTHGPHLSDDAQTQVRSFLQHRMAT